MNTKFNLVELFVPVILNMFFIFIKIKEYRLL